MQSHVSAGEYGFVFLEDKVDIVIQNTSNGEQSCSVNNIRLHSLYNPSKEASRFIESSVCPFNPKYVLITEPALSYCVKPLKEKFPQARLCCVRFTPVFNQWNKIWDKVFNAYNKTEESSVNKNLSEEIFSYMGEEGVSQCFFISWNASEKAFENFHQFTWNEIKKAVLKSQSVLATRNYFAKRWTKNALRFSLFTEKIAAVSKGKCDIVICASGPSLLSSIDNIKKFRDSFFLIAVSSALRPLVACGIYPDLCISTDGGYWAKKHISFALNGNAVPLALSGESGCFASLLADHNVVPLLYGNGTSEDILKSTIGKGLPARRNGSVSGTAAELALSLTSGDVYFCGLDLSFSKGHVHMQPNELEINDAIHDTRTRTMETRISSQSINKASIDIYRSWFSTTDFKGRLYRLSNRYKYDSTLGSIKDVDWIFFESRNRESHKQEKPEFTYSERDINPKKDTERLVELCKNNITKKNWIKEAVPSEYVVLERTTGTPAEEKSQRIVSEGMKDFLNDILRAIHR